MNEPIGFGNTAVFPGDIVSGDDDCVIVIPAHLAEDVAEEAVEMTAFENFVVERVREGVSIIRLYPATKRENQEAFVKWREKNGGLC